MTGTLHLTLMVALGSALGGMARQGSRDLLAILGFDMLALSTFLVNVAGSLLIGLLANMTAHGARLPLPELHRQFLMSGFCGGLTTFSIFSADTVHLYAEQGPAVSFAYVAATVTLSLLACWAGLLMGKHRGTAT